MSKIMSLSAYFLSASRSLLVLVILAGPVSAQQNDSLLAGLPYTVRVVPIASEMRIDHLRFEVFAIRIDGSISAITDHYVQSNQRAQAAGWSSPVRVQQSDGQLFVSGWRQSGLVTLKLRANTSLENTAMSAGLLIVSKTALDTTARMAARSDSSALVASLIPTEARLLRTIISHDGDIEHIMILARILKPSASASRIVADHFKRNGFSRPALPVIQAELRQLLHFQKERLHISVGVHGQGDEALLLIQASAARHSTPRHFLAQR
jgi:hypothetical protein